MQTSPATDKKILISGDSHCIILGNILVGTDPDKVSRFPGVELLHLGPALAFTLPMPSSLNAGARLLEHIETKREQYDAVMLCFGEIDARAHVVKQAVLQSITMTQAVESLVGNYFTYIETLVARFNLPVFIWGPVGTMPDRGKCYNPDYPTVGTEQERNYATTLLNRALADRCTSHPQVHYISISDKLIDAEFRTRTEYYHDGVHLNRKGLSLGLTEIHQRFTELHFDHLAERFPEQVFCCDVAKLRNVSLNGTIAYLSSTTDESIQAGQPLPNPSALPFIFHTQLEDRPRIVIDLGCVHMVKHVEIHNRRDGFQERANSLSVSISTDRYTFTNVYKSIGRHTFGLDGAPLFLSFDSVGHFRYLQLELEDRNHFHLAEIKVWAYSFLSPA